MRNPSRFSQVQAVLCAGLFAAVGARGAAGQEADAPRELLKPPTYSIASPITDRFALKGVYYQPTVDTLLRYDSSAGVTGTEFLAEDTFGMDDELNQGLIEIWIRMADRHRVRVDFYKMSREGDVVMDEVLRFGDTTFLPGENVISDMELRTLGLTYTYSVFRRETFEIGLGVGINLVQMEGAAEVPARFAGEEFDVAGPMASLALDGTWRFLEKWSVNGRVQYLQGNLDDVDGLYAQYHLDVQYRVHRNLAFGLGYSQTRMKVDSIAADFSGMFDLEYAGPEAFVRVSY
jgi:hypothetical protein